MDRAKMIAKVEDVTCWKNGMSAKGTLHMSAHHFIFRYDPPQGTKQTAPNPQTGTSTPTRPRETWYTYPIINYCTYKPAPPAAHQPPSIRIRCRDFTFVSFTFLTDKDARAVYDTIRSCTCKLGSLEKLLAFSYDGAPREKKHNGWTLYDARREFARQGISPKSPEKGWRITNINKDHTYSQTYPSVLVVPQTISDNVLNYAKAYRSRARIPVLTYLHPVNNASITRCSQPMVGIKGSRSAQDEKLVAAIWSTNKPVQQKPPSSTPATPRQSRSTSDLTDYAEAIPGSLNEKQSVDMSGEASESNLKDISDGTVSESGELPRIYGAQQSNLIVDARPTVNAYAMQAIGMGTENMEYYNGAVKEYFGIDNIHVMRKSLNDVIDALKDSDFTNLPPSSDKLQKSNWLKHISLLVDGGTRIARQVGILHSHVLIHCSDGWDRTSQLSSLAQICLDPYFRTIDGFIVLVEKDWLSFGHMFRHRTGHLSSEKWFEIENERIANDRVNETNGTRGARDSTGGGNAFENALSKAQGFFGKKGNEKSDDESDSDEPPYLLTSNTKRLSSIQDEKKKYATKPKETSPVFHQFLDAVYQILYQNPTRFEFNERFLRRLLYHVYACQYGTFLFDNEKERVEWRARERTRSVWDYFCANRAQFVNPKYDPEVDDNVVGKERIILPNKEKTRWWAEMFGRADEEMNVPVPSITMKMDGQTYNRENPFISAPVRGDTTLMDPPRSATPRQADVPGTVVTGVESSEGAIGVGSTKHPTKQYDKMSAGFGQDFAKQGQEALNASLARLGIGRGSGGDRASPSPSRGGARSPRVSREKMEVEMQ